MEITFSWRYPKDNLSYSSTVLLLSLFLNSKERFASCLRRALFDIVRLNLCLFFCSSILLYSVTWFHLQINSIQAAWTPWEIYVCYCFVIDLGSGPVPVVILTYMRSGSSFCGDVLQANDDVFYLFEPLRSVQFHFRESNSFNYLDDKNRWNLL